MQANLSSVKSRRALIARQITELTAEDAELASVEEVLTRLANGGAASVARRGRRKVVQAAARKAGGRRKAVKKGGGRGRRSDAGSQRELVLAALKKPGAGWMDVRQIIATVKDAHGVNIPPRSLSPLLSNMKKAGVIVRQGRRVAAPERARSR